MPRIVSSMYRTSDDGALMKFYENNFKLQRSGQQLKQQREPEQATALEFQTTPEEGTIKNNRAYWKVGFCMPDVASHCEFLREADVNVSPASQFQDIGFMGHLRDPDGNSLELLQHTFEQNFPGSTSDNSISLGQITIRTSKLEKTLAFYEDLGMKQLSIQPVDDYGFCLYFLGFTDDVPPCPDDLKAVENREWLWQRPYCTVEIQHISKSVVEDYEDLKDDELGWLGMKIRMSADEAAKYGEKKEKVLRDPNNIPVHIDVEA